ncbi:hypothetical protein [Lysobacter capsici]|uniref:hypothetical protein n=1 Tax=Lysobacter capsici TaxID=435897 RepID=UPI0012FD2F38|nr:hypothetical protein [Lysobacter capsici]
MAENLGACADRSTVAASRLTLERVACGARSRSAARRNRIKDRSSRAEQAGLHRRQSDVAEHLASLRASGRAVSARIGIHTLLHEDKTS